MVSTFTLSLLMPRDGLETMEGCGERPQHARAHHGAVPLCSQVTSRRAGKRFKQAFVRLSTGCNRVTWDEDDGGGKLSLDLNQVMASDRPLIDL